MKKEIVSVVLTTYGRTNEVRRALQSVLDQTYENLDIIVVDDNTQSAVSEEVKSIVKSLNDDRIRLIKNKKNLGGAMSRNVGIEAAKGEYIAFLDDDDEYLPEKVEKQLALFNEGNNELALVYCYCQSVKNGKKSVQYRYSYMGHCLYDAMRICIAATSQWMCKKSCLKKVGMFSDVPCKQDSTVIVKLLAAGYAVDRVPEILSIYNDETSDNRISSRGNPEKRIRGETALRELCRSHYDKISPQEQKEVEYTFSTVLVSYYYAVNDKEKYKLEMRNIRKTHPLSYRSLKIYFRMFKKRVKRVLRYE